MIDKMTSGEIAKKAGISQKAVRLYDQKGLLKPSSYSEENYRLGDDFVKYISEHKSDLPEEVEIDVKFLDVETEAAWNQIYSEGKYDYVIAYYISSVLHDREHFFERVSEVLSDNGVFSFNGAYVNDWHYWVKEVFEELGLESKFVETLIAQEVTRRDELNATLNKYFGKVESVLLPNCWHYKKIWNPKC